MKLNVVLYEPAIIENVGNIARTCLAFQANLHLIRPYGFIFDRTKLKRSSTNHFEQINLFQYDNWDEFEQCNHGEYFLYTKFGNQSPNQIDFKKIDQNKKTIYLIFGNEQTGINHDILKKYRDNLIRIPMDQSLICLNVANTVAIALYEVVKQLNYSGLKYIIN